MPAERPDHAETLKNIGVVEAAEERAFKRGRDSAELKAQVASHEKRLDTINGSLERNARAVETVSDRLENLKSSVERATAVAKAQADTASVLADRAAKSALDKRTAFFLVVGATTAIASVIIAALALGLGH